MLNFQRDFQTIICGILKLILHNWLHNLSLACSKDCFECYQNSEFIAI